MEEKITLDKESFRSLASGTRITIIKSLDRRRKTLTELSKMLDMSPSTVKEHMDNLCSAGLTVQVDEGHKWKYYELTRKGRNILHPEETKIWILLTVSALAMVGIFYDMVRRASPGPQMMQAASDMLQKGAEESMGPVREIASGTIALPFVHIFGMLVFAVILGSCVAYLVISRKKLITKI